MLVGLQYVGSANGISVMLYNSYKKASVTWDKPYRFTNRDDISDKARSYYLRNYKPLGIRLIEDDTVKINSDKVESKSEEILVENKVDNVDSSSNSEVENKVVDTTEEKESEAVTSEVVDDNPEETAEAKDTSNDSSLISILIGMREEFGIEAIESLSESDLGSLLDSRLEVSQVKEFAKMVGYDYGKTKNKSKIVYGLVDSKLDESIKTILNA